VSKSVFYNGKIAVPGGFVEGMAIEGQNIVCLGSSEEVCAIRDAEKIDLAGRLALPGFIDGHMHFLAYALSLERADLLGCFSVNEVRSRLRAFLDERRPEPGEWVVGRGWNHELFDDNRILTKEDLDDLTPDNPAMLARVCGHIVVLNSRAITLLGLTGESRFAGGVVDLDDGGEPTGVIRESVVEWAGSKLPLPGPEKLRKRVVRAGKETAKVGLTSIHSDDLGSVGGDFQTIIDLYISLCKEDEMPVRITEQLLLRNRPALDHFLSTGWRTVDGMPFFHIGPLKILTDGSMGGRTALLRKEYEDAPGVFGVPIYGHDELDDLVLTAHLAGMQVATHAIGDGALNMCLDAMERALLAKPRDARHYIVHCQMGDMEQYRRMARLGIGAAIQPPFVPSDRPMALKRIGEERALAGYAWKTMKELGIFLSGGSDSPVEKFDPLWGVYTAVARKDENGLPQGGWNPSQKFSVAEAVDLYTRGGAYASFEEHRKGTLAEGMLADVVVLDRDIFSVPEDEIKEAHVALTMVGGRIVYRTD
jgi:predicted amidohydrolase YtcJ